MFNLSKPKLLYKFLTLCHILRNITSNEGIMQITDIVRNNSDRLFIVDTECFIIFTGDSLNDEKPFIRIGTWYDLPVEIIPLVENIILSDKIIGNPSYEQFNIDVRNLETNRYIGGESILKRFLDYQKIFGLDLTNASLVKIEKDIPALPNQKNISNRNQFIGIFYSDGNIKINHGKENIFDLNSINTNYLSCADILNKISINSKNSDRYKSSGFIILDNNPIFYQKGTFTSYQFPDNCFHDFSTLQIDPNHIRELLLPSDNLINISNFLKFKNSRNGKIKLYSDNTEQIELTKKIFKNAIINNERFTNLHINTPEGLKINSYSPSPNIKISFSQSVNPGNEITVSFIKSSSDVGKIVKDKSDLILITYTAYEESTLLFKSTVTPVLLIDDGHPNLRKMNEPDKTVLKNGIQYELKKFNTFDELLNEFKGLDEIKYALENFGKEDKEKVSNLIDIKLEDNESLSVYNILNLLKAFIDHTTDRKKYSSLKDIYQDFYQKIAFNPDNELKSAIKIIIALYDNTCSVIIEPVQNDYKEKFIDVFDEDVLNETTISLERKDIIKRIINDRERLNRLLKLFYNRIEDYPSFDKIKEEITFLKDDISTLREIYSDDFFLNEHSEIKENKEQGSSIGFLKNLIFNLFNRGNKDNKKSKSKTGKDRLSEYSINKNKKQKDKRSSLKDFIINLFNRDSKDRESKIAKLSEVVKLLKPDKLFKTDKLNKDDRRNKDNKPNENDDKRIILQIINKRKFIITPALILILLFLIYPFLKNKYSDPDSGTQNIAVSDSGTQNIAALNLNDTDSETRKNIVDPSSDTRENITDPNLKDTESTNKISAVNKVNDAENKNQIFTVKRVDDKEKEILRRHKVEISEADIYRYSNSVALKNGYAEISYGYALRDRNPHWIYPTNVFIMLDGEKVTVQKGDTLWDLSRAKLEKMNADFYKIIDEIDKTKNKSKINKLITEAEKYSFMKQQIEILASYKKRFDNE